MRDRTRATKLTVSALEHVLDATLKNRIASIIYLVFGESVNMWLDDCSKANASGRSIDEKTLVSAICDWDITFSESWRARSLVHEHEINMKTSLSGHVSLL